jgi:3-deoxy-7-phosphoheptulonate synthase
VESFTFTKKDFLLICGPCAIEGANQVQSILNLPFSPQFIRGGIYKMRTSRNTFQGLGQAAIDIIKELKSKRGFHFITEITDPRQIDALMPIASCFQVGARNMYNYELLKELARYQRPVILKRGFSATINEWLGAAEYLMDLGEEKIILCERGVRSFDTKLRNMLDLGSVIYLKKSAPFKVLVDPSHAMGDRNYVPQAALAALAAGADGLLVEAHPDPIHALSDGQQSLDPDLLLELVERLKVLVPHFDKELKL